MIYANTGTGPRAEVLTGPAPAAVWLDLLSPTDAERAVAAQATGLVVPTLAALAEIESSSRLSTQGRVLTLSTPMAFRGDGGVASIAPLGFVLSPEHVVTIRFGALSALDKFAAKLAQSGAAPSSSDVFVGLLEAIVDRLADVLEQAGGDLDTISHRVFRPARDGQTIRRTDAQMQSALREIGRLGDLVSNLRDSLLGVSRIVPYVNESAKAWLPPELRSRFVTLKQDIVSLTEYDSQLTNKVQFLLDATLGFINIQQNEGIKILTVVSVVGVPPTLIASIYGMNFKNIPELQWAWGYEYGLAVIVLSAVLPLLWFKRRGWI